ncbi:hypothetical protein PGB90_004548 [Kerria lacca]
MSFVLSTKFCVTSQQVWQALGDIELKVLTTIFEDLNGSFCSQTTLVVCVLCMRKTDAVIKILTTLIRDNVAGHPIIHQNQHWLFQPEEGSKNNPVFEAVNGHRSYYLIEKLGLGMDGHQEERKYQQMIRDLGVPTTSYNQPQSVKYF